MTLTCYYASGSPWAWRVLLSLTSKGLAFETKEIHFSKGEGQSPEFLALNPHGQVPVLTDGDLTVYESGAILAYLDRKYPEKPVLGETAEEGALIWQRMLEFQNHFMVDVTNILLPIFRNEMDEKKAEMEESLAKIPAGLAKLGEWLGDKSYFTGDNPTALDFTIYPALALMLRLFSSPASATLNMEGILPLKSTAPAVDTWMRRIEAMDGFDAVYPTHWKDAA